jgi:TadE-like protein.
LIRVGAFRLRALKGQALVELALILPLFVVVMSGILTFGIGVFYQQQLDNAAREAARYAAIHSATSQCPTTSRLMPNLSRLPPDFDLGNYFPCDPPDLSWPQMTAFARARMFGIDTSNVHFSACWSGYWDGPEAYDAAPKAPDGTPNAFRDCTIAGIDPRTHTSDLGCPAPPTNLSDDKASDLAASADGTSANQVTVYACYVWHPPLLGYLLGSTVTMRATITEALQHQK